MNQEYVENPNNIEEHERNIEMGKGHDSEMMRQKEADLFIKLLIQYFKDKDFDFEDDYDFYIVEAIKNKFSKDPIKSKDFIHKVILDGGESVVHKKDGYDIINVCVCGDDDPKVFITLHIQVASRGTDGRKYDVCNIYLYMKVKHFDYSYYEMEREERAAIFQGNVNDFELCIAAEKV